MPGFESRFRRPDLHDGTECCSSPVFIRAGDVHFEAACVPDRFSGFDLLIVGLAGPEASTGAAAQQSASVGGRHPAATPLRRLPTSRTPTCQPVILIAPSDAGLAAGPGRCSLGTLPIAAAWTVPSC